MQREEGDASQATESTGRMVTTSVLVCSDMGIEEALQYD
jgi:hypothetical protein